MTEVRAQLGEARVPGCLVTCVGGGGLALGLLQGLDTCEAWRHVPLVAMETFGANCLAEVRCGSGGNGKKIEPLFMFQARRAGASVSLEAITSEATSLGALRVADRLLERCSEKVIT